MGTRETDQPPLWIATSDLPTSPGHPFYARLTTLLDGHHVDRFVEGLCDRFYAPVMGRPSLAPGRYFRLLLVGYFEGIDSERGIAWRATDSLAVRSFLRVAVDEAPPDLYLWLTYRTFNLKRPLRLTWPLLYRQFGVDPARAGDKLIVNDFREKTVCASCIKSRTRGRTCTTRRLRGRCCSRPRRRVSHRRNCASWNSG